MMRGTTVVCALLLLVGGCDSETDSHTHLQAEIAKTKARREALEAERLKMQRVSESTHSTKRRLEAKVASLTDGLNKLENENAELKRAAAESRDREEKLRREIQALEARRARGPRPAAPPQPTGGPKAHQPPKPAGKEEQAVLLRVSMKAMEERITELRSRVAKGQAKVSSVIRTTVDVRMQPPPSGMVIPPKGSYQNHYGGPDGLILRRERVITGSHQEGRRLVQDYYYRYVPIGPAIKRGDFRTAHDRDAAIAEAKNEVLPLHEERRRLEADLEQLKKDLVALEK